MKDRWHSFRSPLVGLVVGLIFGIGLSVSGMTSPIKVQDFLDVFGSWDPSLAWVMGGAVAVYAVFFRWLRPGMSKPVFESHFRLPTRTEIDGRLLAGSAIFGVGWGLGGICPGPAITAITQGGVGILIFLGAMAVGMRLASRF